MKILQAFHTAFVSRLPLRCCARDPVTRNKPENRGGFRNVQETCGKVVGDGEGILWLLKCLHLRSVVYNSWLEKEEKPFQFGSKEQQTLHEDKHALHGVHFLSVARAKLRTSTAKCGQVRLASLISNFSSPFYSQISFAYLSKPS